MLTLVVTLLYPCINIFMFHLLFFLFETYIWNSSFYFISFSLDVLYGIIENLHIQYVCKK